MINKTLLASDGAETLPPIGYNCPRCKTRLESPASQAGTKKGCPSCGQRLQIPAVSPQPITGSTTAELQFYYMKNGQRFGPLPLAIMQKLVATGQLERECLVWWEGKWLRAEQIHLLFPPTPTAVTTTIPAAQVSAPASQPGESAYPQPRYEGMVLGLLGGSLLLLGLTTPAWKDPRDGVFTFFDFYTKFTFSERFLGQALLWEKLAGLFSLSLLLIGAVTAALFSGFRAYPWLRWSGGLATTSIFTCAGRVFWAATFQVGPFGQVEDFFALWGWGWLLLIGGTVLIYVGSWLPRESYQPLSLGVFIRNLSVATGVVLITILVLGIVWSRLGGNGAVFPPKKDNGPDPQQEPKDGAKKGGKNGLADDLPPAELNRYNAVDRHALLAPPEEEQSVQALARYLTEPFKTDREKARAIYRWQTDRIAYDVEGFFAFLAGKPLTGYSAKAVLKSRKTVCEGHANLFKELAMNAGLKKVEKISGNAKGYGYEPGEKFVTNHAWNAVEIEGQSCLVDCTWGAGGVDKDKGFIKEFEEIWFLTPADQFVFSHFPDNPDKQFLAQPLDKETYCRWPEVPKSLFKFGFPVSQVRDTLNQKDFAGLVSTYDIGGHVIRVHKAPLTKRLAVGLKYEFDIQSKSCLNFALVINGNVQTVKTVDGRYQGIVAPEKGKLQLSGQFRDKGDGYWPFLEYLVE